MDEACRAATAEDLAIIADLFDAAVQELEPTKGGSLWARREAGPLPPHDRLAAALHDDDRHLAVGTIDGTPVGYAVIVVEELRDGGRLARLTDVYVLPEGRGVGVGEAMIGHVLAWSTDAGCFGIDSVALPGNRATKNFFETHGLVTRALVVHRALAP